MINVGYLPVIIIQQQLHAVEGCLIIAAPDLPFRAAQIGETRHWPLLVGGFDLLVDGLDVFDGFFVLSEGQGCHDEDGDERCVYLDGIDQEKNR
jgi:hypothetical protein